MIYLKLRRETKGINAAGFAFKNLSYNSSVTPVQLPVSRRTETGSRTGVTLLRCDMDEETADKVVIIHALRRMRGLSVVKISKIFNTSVYEIKKLVGSLHRFGFRGTDKSHAALTAQIESGERKYATSQYGRKQCRKCLRIKYKHEFSLDNQRSDGRRSYCRECTSEYQKKHSDIFTTNEINRRARKLSGGGKITRKEWAELKHRYNYTCLCCDKREPEIKLSMDHVLPLVMGGSNSIENIQPLCMSCNFKKRTKHIDYRPQWEVATR